MVEEWFGLKIFCLKFNLCPKFLLCRHILFSLSQPHPHFLREKHKKQSLLSPLFPKFISS